MKHFLLYYSMGALTVESVSAGVAGCRKRVMQSPLGFSRNWNDTASSTTVSWTSLTTTTVFEVFTTSTATSTVTISLSTTTEIVQPQRTTPTAPAQPIPKPPFSDYIPIFFDDFNGTSGTLPSTANWIFDIGTSYRSGPPNWGNNELEIYTTSTSNIALTSSSTLLITPLLVSSPFGPQWTSARIETVRDDFGCPANGKLFIQARIKLGNDPTIQQEGIWPAFWALGSSYRGNYSDWPQATEWDILESTNGSSISMMTIHCGISPYGPCNEKQGISDSVDMQRGVWNTVGFGVDRTNGNWEEESITWYLNGNARFVVKGGRVGNQADWEELVGEGHFLLLDVAVGGSAGVVGLGTVGGEGTEMEVDYVGVWVSGL